MDMLSYFCSHMHNGVITRSSVVLVPDTRFIRRILIFLLELGLINGYGGSKFLPFKLRVVLKYAQDDCVVKAIEQLSKKGKRLYIRYHQLRYYSHLSDKIFILSTRYGLVTGEEASLLGVGGELLLKVLI